MEYASFLHELDAIVADRLQQKSADSYTARLASAGIERIAQKIGEEGVEVALAALAENPEKLPEEAADLLYHLLVLLRVKGRSIDDVLAVLEARHTKKTS